MTFPWNDPVSDELVRPSSVRSRSPVTERSPITTPPKLTSPVTFSSSTNWLPSGLLLDLRIKPLTSLVHSPLRGPLVRHPGDCTKPLPTGNGSGELETKALAPPTPTTVITLAIKQERMNDADRCMIGPPADFFLHCWRRA